MKPRKQPAGASVLASLQAGLPDTEISSLFGKPCLKRGGKAFVARFGEDVVFKLDKDAGVHAKALAIPGAALWDPSGMKRPMKAWVVVPKKHAARWPELARSAFAD
jgi:hypothetical protein